MVGVMCACIDWAGREWWLCLRGECVRERERMRVGEGEGGCLKSHSAHGQGQQEAGASKAANDGYAVQGGGRGPAC